MSARRWAMIPRLTGAVLATWLGLSIVLAGEPAAADQPPPPSARAAYPVSEDYGADLARFAEDASAFLRDRADSPSAPRVALDLLAVLTAQGKEAPARKVKALLLTRYQDSPAGRFVLGTFFNASYFDRGTKAFRDFINGLADQVLAEPSEADLVVLMRAVAVGVDRIGPTIVDDGTLALKLRVLADAAGDLRVQDRAATRLRELREDDPLRPAASLVLNEKLTPLQRVVQLHAAKGDNLDVTRLVNFLVARLPQADRESPLVIRVRAETHLAQGEMQAALALLDRLPTRDEPRERALRAWCLASTGRSTEAVGLLRDSAGTGAAGASRQDTELADAIAGSDDALAQHVQAVAAAVEVARRGVEQVELELSVLDRSGVGYGIYGSFAGEDRFEFQLRRGDHLVAAYQTG